MQGGNQRVKGFVEARNLIKKNITKIKVRIQEIIDRRIDEA